MGGLKKHMPVTRWTYLVATWAIAGFPWASGFYSKDEILWKAFTARDLAFLGHSAPWLGPAIFLLGILTATGTSFYMFRSYYMTFTGTYRGRRGHAEEHDEDPHSAHAAPHHATAAHPQDNVDPNGAGAHATAPSARRSRAPSQGRSRPRPPRRRATRVARVDHGRPGRARRRARCSPALLGIPALWTGHEPAPGEVARAVAARGGPLRGVPPRHRVALPGPRGRRRRPSAGSSRALLFKDGTSTVPAELKKRFFGAWTVVYNKYYVDEAVLRRRGAPLPVPAPASSSGSTSTSSTGW